MGVPIREHMMAGSAARVALSVTRCSAAGGVPACDRDQGFGPLRRGLDGAVGLNCKRLLDFA